jgi:hypothetical protein
MLEMSTMIKTQQFQILRAGVMTTVAGLVMAWGGMAALAGPGSDRLHPGEMLRPGEYLLSINRIYTLRLQSDGNVVIYERQGEYEKPIWATGTNDRAVDRLVMQHDGNLVLYSPGQSPLWSSGTVGRTNSFVVMQSDGNLVIYAPGDPVWASDTRR